MQAEQSKLVPVEIWDLSIRIFHWLLATLVAVSYLSGEFEFFDIHMLSGQAIAVLLIFRIVWGLIGSPTARISSLFFSPRAYLDYFRSLFRRKPSYSFGHSPIGSLAVIAILTILIVQTSTGLFATDVDGLLEGPFAYYINYEISRFASDVHLFNQQLVLAAVIVHLSAILFYYLYKHENLVKPMLTGIGFLPENQANSVPKLKSIWTGLIVLVLTAVIMLTVYAVWG